MIDSKSTIKSLLHIVIDGVSALQIYMEYIKTATCKDLNSRTQKFVTFAKWASETDFHWDYTSLDRYSTYLRSLGNAESTIKVKVSNIRQFITSAESCGIIPKCVYYAKRGRKSKNPKANLVVYTQETKAGNSTKSMSKGKSCGYKKSFLYDLFGLGCDFSIEILKSAYRKLANEFHPDHACGSKEKFIACNEAYTYLMDPSNRVMYRTYTQTNARTRCVSEFVHSVFDRIGGYTSVITMM